MNNPPNRANAFIAFNLKLSVASDSAFQYESILCGIVIINDIQIEYKLRLV
jgi:hypothetical protein